MKLFSIIILLGSSPILLLISLFIYIESRTGVIFKQVRIGLHKKEFVIYKFKTMENNKVTFIGKFLRKLGLDEIPQLINVIKGDMSIVGPRPLSVLHYERDMAQGNVTRSLLKGGLLGLGHINKGTGEMGNSIYEYEYVDQYLTRSSFGLMRLDLWIIWKGIIIIIKGFARLS